MLGMQIALHDLKDNMTVALYFRSRSLHFKVPCIEKMVVSG